MRFYSIPEVAIKLQNESFTGAAFPSPPHWPLPRQPERGQSSKRNQMQFLVPGW